MFKKICCSFFLLSILISPIEIVAKDVPIDSKELWSNTTTVFVATSTIDVMTAIAKQYKKTYPLQKINIAHSGSGILALQIAKGAPANIFLSASIDWINYLEDLNIIVIDSIKQIPLKTNLVLIGKKGLKGVDINNFADYLVKNNAKIALGNPKSVPAGVYTDDFLKRTKVYNKIKDNMLYVNSVRASLNYIKLGEADLAVVYSTDISSIPNHYEFIATLDPFYHRDIKYYGVIIAERNSIAANLFYEYLFTDDALKIYKEFGF